MAQVLNRGSSAGLIASLSGHFNPVLLTEADWPGEMIRIQSGFGTIVWDARSWLGSGKLVQFIGPEEAGGLATSEAVIRIAATISDILAERGKVIRNRRVTVYFGTTTKPAGNVLVGDPIELFSGYFDSRSGSLTRTGDDLDHDMVLGLGIGPSARSSASITHSREDQIEKFPGDEAGRHVQTANKKLANPEEWPE
jgi:hypothetical protein